ncbi:MAG: 6,7-dimethyl-8-ribityllumazine synthase, partial [Clostridia bacterium]|nr:6,7-dimethyl-8-ribityllumazine synthase [Clostridia bacterium]
MKTFEGNVVAKNVKIAIVAARFNEFIVSKLIGGAEDALLRHGVKEDDITLAWVPGAFEIPVIAKKLAESGVRSDHLNRNIAVLEERVNGQVVNGGM